MPYRRDELEVGKKYQVVLDDCCVKARFVSRLVYIGPNDVRTYDYEMLMFENGVAINIDETQGIGFGDPDERYVDRIG